MPQPISNPIFPLNKVIRDFMEQTNMQIKVNLITQKVWPTEIYPGYKIKNEANKRDGLPHSTGDGSRSFQSRLVRADQAGNVTLVFNYNDYMRYVDIGVGGKRKTENVERSKNARFRNRYIAIWDPTGGQTHRPAIMMEYRHLQERIRDYLVDFYGYEGQVSILDTFTDATINLW